MVRKSKSSLPKAFVGASITGGSPMASYSSNPVSSPADDEGPDPRWPSLHRWTTKLTASSPASRQVSPAAPQLHSSAPAKSANVVSPAQFHGEEITTTNSTKTIHGSYGAAPSSTITPDVTGLSAPPCHVPRG